MQQQVLLTILFLWIIQTTAASSEEMERLEGLQMDWTVVDLEKHHLSWNDVNEAYGVYYHSWNPRWGEKKEDWMYLAVNHPCEPLVTINNISKCTIEIPYAIGSILSVKLCLHSNKSMCEPFRIEGDDVVDVLYYTKLTSMTIERNISSTDNITLFVKFPPQVRYYYDADYGSDVYYSISARRYNRKTDECYLDGPDTETFKKSFEDPTTENGFRENVVGLKPGTTYCMLLQYKVNYLGKIIEADSIHPKIRTEAEEFALIVVLIIPIFVVIIVTFLVNKYFVQPWWNSIRDNEEKNQKVLNDILKVLGNAEDNRPPVYIKTYEKFDELKREKIVKPKDEPKDDLPSSATSSGSDRSTLPLPRGDVDQNSFEHPLLPPYQSSEELSDENGTSSPYSPPPWKGPIPYAHVENEEKQLDCLENQTLLE